MTDNINIIELRAPNIRELTKKERIFGLNVKSWYLVLFAPLILQAYIGILNAIFSLFGIAIFFYIAEFFDEDITDIFFSRVVIKSPTKLFWS